MNSKELYLNSAYIKLSFWYLNLETKIDKVNLIKMVFLSGNMKNSVRIKENNSFFEGNIRLGWKPGRNCLLYVS